MAEWWLTFLTLKTSSASFSSLKNVGSGQKDQLQLGHQRKHKTFPVSSLRKKRSWKLDSFRPRRLQHLGSLYWRSKGLVHLKESRDFRTQLLPFLSIQCCSLTSTASVSCSRPFVLQCTEWCKEFRARETVQSSSFPDVKSFSASWNSTDHLVKYEGKSFSGGKGLITKKFNCSATCWERHLEEAGSVLKPNVLLHPWFSQTYPRTPSISIIHLSMGL